MQEGVNNVGDFPELRSAIREQYEVIRGALKALHNLGEFPCSETHGTREFFLRGDFFDMYDLEIREKDV